MRPVFVVYAEKLMKRSICSVLLVLPLVAVGGPVLAQDWEFSAAIYGWGPDSTVSLDTPVGSVTGELSLADAWESLDLALMGVVTAQRGQLGFILDSMVFKLSDDRATPGVLGFTGASLSSQVNITNAYVTWRVMDAPSGQLDLGAGVRFYNTQNEVTLTGGPGPFAFDISDDWIDPVVALRYRADFTPKWYGTVFADVGGFGAGSEFTWQGVATVGYRINDSFAIEGGYRIIESDRIEANGDIDIRMSGPVIGARFRF
jgi:hypothetical protein